MEGSSIGEAQRTELSGKAKERSSSYSGPVTEHDRSARPAFAEPDDDDLRWNVARLPGRLPEATYLVVANAAQFRLLVDVVADEQGHSLTGVSREQLPALLSDRVPEALYADLEPVLDARLGQLVAWGTFESWQEEARTDEDFLRNRERFQLTERGAAVNRLARDVEGQDRATSSTAVLAPPILATQSALVLEALADQRYADAAATLALVQTTLADMAKTASVWQSRLAATIGGVPDEDKVRRLRQTVTDYVDMWGAGVDVHSAAISDSARRLLDSDLETWRHLAVHRLPAETTADAIAAVADEIHDAIRTLDVWFTGPHSQAWRLRRQIRDAVVPLVRSHRTLLAIGGTVSRRAELLDLISRIDQAATDRGAWDIWCRATGLFAARHLGLETEAVASPADTSFWAADPAPVERRLRTSGPRALAGRSPLIPDTARQRAAARARAVRDRVRTAAAEQALAARSGMALSTWSALDEDEADLLLDLLATARIVPGTDWTTRVAASRDGRWEAHFSRVEPRRSAIIRMPSGRLVVEDCIVEVVS